MGNAGSQFNHTYSQIQRSIHVSSFYTIRPRPGERVGAYCECLQQYRDPVAGTNEAISDTVLLHLLNTRHHRRALRRERCLLANHQVGDPNNTSRSLLRSNGGPKKLFCKHCKKKGHLVATCSKKQGKGSGKSSGTEQSAGKKHPRDDAECQHCWETGHMENNCPLRERTDRAEIKTLRER